MADSTHEDLIPLNANTPQQGPPISHEEVTSHIPNPMNPPNESKHSSAVIQPAASGTRSSSLPTPPVSDEDEDDSPILTPTSSTRSQTPELEADTPTIGITLNGEAIVASAEENVTESADHVNCVDEGGMTSTPKCVDGSSESQDNGQGTSSSVNPNVKKSQHEETQGHLTRLSNAGGIWIQDGHPTETPQAVWERRFVNDGTETRIVNDDGIRVAPREDDEILSNSPSSVPAEEAVQDVDTMGRSMPENPDPQQLGMSTQSSSMSGVMDQSISPGSISQDMSPDFSPRQSGSVNPHTAEDSHVQCNSNSNNNNNNSNSNSNSNDSNNSIINSSDTSNVGAHTPFQIASTFQGIRSPNVNSSGNNFHNVVNLRSFSSGNGGSTSFSWNNNRNSNGSQNSTVFRDQTLSSQILNGATISDCRITSCSGRNLRITDCTFSSCDFSNATISDCSFSGSNLRDFVTITDCSFSGSNLQDCNLRDCSFNDSQVVGGSRRDCVWNRSNVN